MKMTLCIRLGGLNDEGTASGAGTHVLPLLRCQHQSLLSYAAGKHYTQQGYCRTLFFLKFSSRRLSRSLCPLI